MRFVWYFCCIWPVVRIELQTPRIFSLSPWTLSRVLHAVILSPFLFFYHLSFCGTAFYIEYHDRCSIFIAFSHNLAFKSEEHILFLNPTLQSNGLFSIQVSFHACHWPEHDYLCRVEFYQPVMICKSIGYHCLVFTLRRKATIHQVTTMLSTSENVPFPGHNHLLTTCGDDLSL